MDLWSDIVAMNLSISTHPSLVIALFVKEKDIVNIYIKRAIASEGGVEIDRSLAIMSDHA